MLKRGQQGLSLILVVFSILLLSVLGGAMVQLMTVSSDSVAREVLSARAFMAAESGAQRLLSDIWQNGPAACTVTAGVRQIHPLTFSGLPSCSDVSVDCVYVQVPAATGSLYYTVISTGSCGPAGDGATRVIEVQARDIQP